jgi:hypothetical protein
MLSVSQTTLDTINQSASITAIPKCWIEYNMNDIIDGVTVRGPNGTDANPAGDLEVSKTAADGSTYKPFTKLFPITSIINPRRPQGSGVQYFILGDPSAQKTIVYSADKAYNTRMYLPGSKTSYKYWVTPKSSPSAALSNCIINVNYPAAKTAAINKVTVKFESSHGLPATWSLKATLISGGEVTIATNATATIPANGLFNLYYNGSTWTTTEFTTPSTPINISKLSLQINTVTVANGYVGIIEVAGRYVKDASENLVTFNTTKRASDQPDGLLPVGDVTANMSDYVFNFFDKSYFSYDKTYAFNYQKTNFYRDIILKPFFQIGSENIKQGVYFLSEYSVDEFGGVTVQALDGAKELQEIFPPDIVIQESSSQAIVRRLLDSVGFTNYNFNKTDKDTSSIRPYYWYTDNTKTVWQHIQDLCKDTQMIASFDENNILQFYTREYIFSDKTSNFKFRYSANGLNLANIISMNSSDVPSVKTVKVIYTPRLSSSYEQNADDLYDAPVIILGAASLVVPLPASAPAEPDLNGTGAAPLGSVTLQPIVIDGYATKLNAYSGYLVIEQEIIEYDAIKFYYTPTEGGAVKYVWITSDSDISKFEGLSEPNTFKPTFQYRIKTRNAFNVLPAAVAHDVNTTQLKAEWGGRILNTTSGVSTMNDTRFTMDTIPAKGNSWSQNFSQDVPRSMMTVFAPNTVASESKDANGVITTIYKDNDQLTMVSPNAIDKDFTAGPIHSYTNTDGSFTSQNFVIGTSMYFPLIKNASGQDTGEQRTKGGIAFCLNSDNTSGYFLCINTSQNVTKDKNYRDVTMYKIVSGKLVEMSDTQTNSGSSAITGISGGELYRVDIKVNQTIKNGTEKNLVFKIMFNNTTFVIHDKTPLAVTKKIALCSYQGPVSYDYVYTKAISEEEYTQNKAYNLYQGYLGANSAIVKYFSDFIFSGKANVTDSLIWVKEFGPVAREIRRIQTRYTYAPATPRYAQAILNPNVTVIGESLDSFSMDVFVMNNSGAFTELSDGGDKRFMVVGDYVLAKDPFEYIDPATPEEEKTQGIAFESTWIQKETEAKALHDWIKKQWSKQQRVVSIETFFNPLLQIGDIIEISYPLNSFYSSEDAGQTVSKYVIIEVNNTSDLSGITSIQARSIYTG